MADKQIRKEKVKKAPRNTGAAAPLLSLFFSLSVLYSYLELYYPDAMKPELFILCGIGGLVMSLMFLPKEKSRVLIPIAGAVLAFMFLVFRDEVGIALKDLAEGFIAAYNRYMYVPIDMSFVQFYRASGFLCLFLLIHYWVLIWNAWQKFPLISALPALGLIAMGLVTNEFPGFAATAAMLGSFFALLSLRSTDSPAISLGIAAVTLAAAFAINFTLLPLYNSFTAAFSHPLIEAQTKIVTDIKGGNTDKLMSDILVGGGKETVLEDDELDQSGKIMLTVTSAMPVTETMYLRGYSAAEYTGFSWVANDESKFRYYCRDKKLSQKSVYESHITDIISTTVNLKYVGDESNYIHSPYFSRLPEGAEIVSDNYLARADTHVTEYDLSVFWPLADSDVQEKYSPWVEENYLSLGPLENSEALEDICSAYTGSDLYDKVSFTEDVLASCRYTKSPAPMPKDADYVEYFLTESKEGYCQHFASAAVMILRKLGVPARYVSGYAIPADNFVKTSYGYYYSVPDRLSHAWVEIYTRESGWTKYDFTPAVALANPALSGEGHGAAALAGENGAAVNTPEEPYNYLSLDPDEEFIFEEDDYIVGITLDFFDFVPIIIGLVIVSIITFIIWRKMSGRFEFYRVSRFNFSDDSSRRFAIDRSFRALEFCVPARNSDDDYSYMDYALSKYLDGDEIALYKAILEENSYGNGWSFDENEVTDLLKKLRNKLIYSLKPLKQFIFLYILCY